jgi:hypothetical protein
MINQKPQPIVHCPACGRPMRLAGIIPGIGALPELWTFECRGCAEAVTEAKDTLLSDTGLTLLERAD